jgi:hypothetical protein
MPQRASCPQKSSSNLSPFSVIRGLRWLGRIGAMRGLILMCRRRLTFGASFQLVVGLAPLVALPLTFGEGVPSFIACHSASDLVRAGERELFLTELSLTPRRTDFGKSHPPGSLPDGDVRSCAAVLFDQHGCLLFNRRPVHAERRQMMSTVRVRQVHQGRKRDPAGDPLAVELRWKRDAVASQHRVFPRGECNLHPSEPLHLDATSRSSSGRGDRFQRTRAAATSAADERPFLSEQNKL